MKVHPPRHSQRALFSDFYSKCPNLKAQILVTSKLNDRGDFFYRSGLEWITWKQVFSPNVGRRKVFLTSFFPLKLTWLAGEPPWVKIYEPYWKWIFQCHVSFRGVIWAASGDQMGVNFLELLRAKVIQQSSIKTWRCAMREENVPLPYTGSAGWSASCLMTSERIR